MNSISIWPEGPDHIVALPPPQIRYEGEQAIGRKPDHHAGAVAWEKVAETHWCYDDHVFRFDVRLTPASASSAQPSRILTASLTALVAASVGRYTLILEAPSDSPPHFLDRYLRWRPLAGTAFVNDFGQLVVRWSPSGKACTELRFVKGMTSCELSWARKRLRLAVDLDAAALHPRWHFSPAGRVSTAAPPWKEGQSVSMDLLLTFHDSLADAPPVASRFPGGAEAGFVLTDHCDFDDNDRLRLFLYGDGRDNGWLGRGLRLTKGVFMLPSILPDRPAVPSLDDTTYRTLIDALHKDGSEIAPHALTETGNLPGSTFIEALGRFARQWSPATWIDHGNTIRYCYTMGGADDPEYDLLGTLNKNGFRSLWSYHDIPVHGSATLNLLDAPRSDSLSMGVLLVRHLLHGEVLIALHYVRSFLERHLRGRSGRFIMRSLSTLRGLAASWSNNRGITRTDIAHAWRRMFGNVPPASANPDRIPPEPYTREELFTCGAAVYPERAVPLYRSDESELLFFSTKEAVHTRDIYTLDAINRLIEARGLHVGHCYLMNNLPYIAGLFARGSSDLQLTAGWTEFVKDLAELVRSGRIWNPTAGDLTMWMRDMQSVSLFPASPGEVILENSSPRPLHAFTLLISPTVSPETIRWSGIVPSGWRPWQEWLAIWGDLPARSRTVVQWEVSSL